MLWSVLTGQPKKFSNYILSKWLKRGGYLLKTPKSKSPVSKTVFRPNRNCIDELASLGVTVKRQTKINHHNEQVVDAVIQGLYAAKFKAYTLGVKRPESSASVRNTADSSQHHSQYDWNEQRRNNYMQADDNIANYSLEDLIGNSYDYDNSHNVLDSAMPTTSEDTDAFINHGFGVEAFTFNEFTLQNENLKSEIPFWPDFSICRRNSKQECFIELDNLTETLPIQTNKILSYIWYAFRHPQNVVTLVYVVNDGSVRKNSRDGFVNRSQKISSLADRILKSYIMDDNNQPVYLADLYSKADNLKVFITGESEAYLDLAQFLLDSDYTEDYQQTAQELVDYVNQGQEWNASLLSAEHYAQADAEIKFRYRHTELNYVQPVIFGQEHGLDTIIRTHILTVEADQHPQTHNYPIIIYPRRERKILAITLTEYDKKFPDSQVYNYHRMLLVQPLWDISNNQQLQQELHWLLRQFKDSVFSYFRYGYLFKTINSNGKTKTDFGHDYFEEPQRSYAELHQVASASDWTSSEFVEQISINEVPIGVYQVLLNRCCSQDSFSIPVIFKLPFANEKASQVQVPYTVTIDQCLFGVNSTDPKRRLLIKMY